MRKISIVILCMALFSAASRSGSADIIIDFEELTQFTGDNPAGGGKFFNGNDGSGSNSNGWSSGGVFFNNTYTDAGNFDFWSGWSYSNVVNTTSPGFTNQYAAWPGGGADGFGGANPGENYAVAFGSGAYFNLPTLTRLNSVELSNTTYAALSMLNGDSFAKKFGGVTGDDADFLRVTLTGFKGLNGMGDAVGSVTTDLADYTFDDNSQDYVLEGWLEVDLSGLSNARSVSIEFESSDVSSSGFINTPTYLALDNLNLTSIPEPSSIALLGLGTTIVMIRRRVLRRRKAMDSAQTAQ